MIATSTGFADPIHDAQAVFRALLDAMSRPGHTVPLPAAPQACPLPHSMAATILTLADHETTIWLDPGLANNPEVAKYLRFTTGAKIVSDPRAATFALVSDLRNMPQLETFAQGTPEYPDRATTIIVTVDKLDASSCVSSPSQALVMTGPGIDGTARLTITPEPPGLARQLASNRQRFPMGVDLIFCAPDTLAALPRSVRIKGGT